MSMLGTLQGWRRHHRHPGDTLVPSQLWGIKVGCTPGRGMSPRSSLGSPVSPQRGVNMGGHPEDGDITKSRLGVPQHNEPSTWGTPHGWECPQEPPWCPHVPSHAQGDDLGTSRRPWAVCVGCPHGPPGCPCVPHPG